MTCECQRLIPGANGSELFFQRPMKLVGFFLVPDEKVDEMIDKHFAKRKVKTRKILRRAK